VHATAQAAAGVGAAQAWEQLQAWEQRRLPWLGVPCSPCACCCPAPPSPIYILLLAATRGFFFWQGGGRGEQL